ncbi:uncharacterized protein VICG_01108 [Vittaforma corneae ATCC 50505]|uniref:Proteasome subunit beta n=1 Tax=Vittaforma corneae (strain ATCC 50505) TaxID=993615 RepID=L2GMQ7_VITCO|nr:uncharacterized protein VICG_01108 [Vittaforma corneae ATCC 50505]ELA41924.1 hypothetical protein VICG_01108 [Vittaforma corneae ATCC 50505]
MQRGVFGINAIGFKYKNGVIAAVDTGASYGMKVVYGMQSVFKATDNCIIVFSGLLSDVQFLRKFIKQEIESDVGRKLDPQGIHKMIQRILYQKRSEAAPMNVSAIVCGINQKKNEIFESTDNKGRMLGVVNSKGNFWFEDSAAVSFSSNFVLPILRERDLDNLEKEDAIKLMEECFRILCYKDCRSTNNIQIGIVEEGNMEILQSYNISTNWMIGKQEEEILIE